MKKIGKKLHRIFSFAMGVILVVETINCAGLTVHASEGSVSAGDAIVINEELKEDVTAAEKAAQAAEEAAQAAQEALKAAEDLAKEAGDAALETDADGNYTQEVTGEDGTVTEEPVLKEEINEAITDAENKVDVANDATADVKEKTEEKLDEIVENAEADTKEQLDAAEKAAADAEAAKQKALDAKTKAEEAEGQFAAEKAAKEAAAAAEEAQEAADTAKVAYDEAQKIFDDALAAYNKAVAELLVENGDAQQAAQAALDEAQKALEVAEGAVTAAKTEYDKAMADNATAQAAAEEAEKQAGIAEDAAEDTVENLENVKDVDVKALEEEKAVKEQELQAAIDAQPIINAEQDAIIAEAQAKKDAADAEIAKYNAAADVVNDLTDTSWKIYSELERAQIIIENGTGYCLRLGKKIKQSDIDKANQTIAKYNEARTVMDFIDIVAQQQASLEAQDDISNANATKSAAAQAISDKTTEIAGITASIETVTDYIYDNDEAVTYDMKDNTEYQNLLEELKAATADYNGSVALREKYEDTIDTDGDGLFTKIQKFFEEISMEYNLNGTELSFDWKNGIIYTNDGLTLMIGKDQQNVQTLLKWENDKLIVVTVDEAEFGTYSATFDKVAAAQAANRAAKAAENEAAALAKYDAALAALEAAKARLEKAKLNKLSIDTAAEALAIASQNVENTKLAWERAQKAADDAKIAADEAQEIANEKPVKVRYYILNRGLVQPSESPVTSYPKGNYSTASVVGELKKGEENIAAYKKGVTGAAVNDYLEIQPTTDEINTILGEGNELKEGESVTWYVIKTEGDGYHVDGIISGQKFNITVRFGYYADEEKTEFVDLAESKTVTVGLGESYKVDSVAIDEYVAETAAVEGVATEDKTLFVEYTKEETRTVTINYYRGSVAGTLLGTQELQVAKSKVDAYASTIRTNWLNLKKPGDCNPGELMSYVVTEDSAVANVVYAPIPVTPVVPTPEDEEPEAPDTEPETTVTTVEVPTTIANAVTTPAAPTTIQTQNAVAPAEPTVIEENQTPLAPTIDNNDQNGNGGSKEQEVVTIEEEEAPLAAPGNCWIHWLILLLTVVYTVYELIRCIARNNKINKLQDNAEQAEA